MRRSIVIIAFAAALGSAVGSVLAQSVDSPLATLAQESAQPPSESRHALAAAQGRLAWRLIQDAAPGVDPTISPAGLASVFAVLGEGGDAKMKSAIVKALGFEGADPKPGLAALKEARASLSSANPAVFVSRDRIVFAPNQEPSPIVRAGLESLGVSYSVDDLSKVEAIQKINAWVNQTTDGAIPEILGQPLEKPNLVALNALHFKAKWKAPFDPKATVDAPFVNVDRKSDPVAMMRAPEAQRAFRVEKGYIGVELPFADDRFSLIVVTTTDAPKTVKEFAGAADWLSGDGFAPRRGDIALPRFALEGHASLLPALGKMGLSEGLKSPTAFAAFGPGVTLTQIEQRTTIEVDEEGAEAAAATAVVVGRALEVDDALHMVVDKPFVFALRDRQSELILVAGYVGHAPKGKGA